jgi:hypothetical protein
MRKEHKQNGSAHVIVIVILALALAGTLGVVFYQNFIAKKQSSTADSVTQGDQKSDSNKTPSPAVPATTITQSDRSGWLRFTNNILGYQIDYPAQIYGSTGCHSTNQWYDNYGKQVTAPVTSYLVDEGMVDLTILNYPSQNMALITQKRAPLFTAAIYGAENRSYNSACEMTDVTPGLLLDKLDTSKSISTSWRPLQVFKLSSQDEIATKATSLYGLPGTDTVSGVRYSLGNLTGGRQKVTYDFDVKAGSELVGYGRVDTWYYPGQKALVSVSLGQSVAFASDSNLTTVYDQQIVDSFKLIK